MTKPRAIKWLEEQSGERLQRRDTITEEGRHLSLRIPTSLAAALELLASERGETLSQVARRLLAEGVARTHNPDRAALDTAIAALEKLRATVEPPPRQRRRDTTETT